MRHEIPVMLGAGGGAIVNLGKHGVVGLTKVAALDYAAHDHRRRQAGRNPELKEP